MSDVPGPGGPMMGAVVDEFRRIEQQARAALAQITDEEFFRSAGPEDNSPAVLVKHMAGNLRSRFTDFLTTDGEKPDRRRDTEFVIGAEDSRTALMAAWEGAWQGMYAALGAIHDDQLSRVVRIRGEPHTVLQAAIRQLTHHAGHSGQLVMIAKHLRGGEWRTLSIPRGESEAWFRRHRP